LRPGGGQKNLVGNRHVRVSHASKRFVRIITRCCVVVVIVVHVVVFFFSFEKGKGKRKGK
jgi:hypothetical protein